MVEGFRRTWRAVALAVVFALVGASFALAMPAAINFVTRSVTPEVTVLPLPPGPDPSPLYTPAALDPEAAGDAGEAETAPVAKKALETSASDSVRGDPRGEGEARRSERARKDKKTKKPKGERPVRPDRPEKPEKPNKPAEPEKPEKSNKPAKPEKPEPPDKPEPAESGEPDGQTGSSGKHEEKPKEDPPAPDPASEPSEDEGKGNGKGKGNSARPSHEPGGANPHKSDNHGSQPEPGPPSDPGLPKDDKGKG